MAMVMGLKGISLMDRTGDIDGQGRRKLTLWHGPVCTRLRTLNQKMNPALFEQGVQVEDLH